MDPSGHAAIEAVCAYLREYFPEARIETSGGGGGPFVVEVTTGVRRYRLLLEPELLRATPAADLVARCRADSVAWRLADTTDLLMTRSGTRRPRPDDDT